MKKILLLLIFLIFVIMGYGQKSNYPGPMEIRNYKIGDKADTTLFEKIGDLYFPDYLDGWTYSNYNRLPRKYRKLPIALWQLKSDSTVALTLLNDIILNIVVSNMEASEKDAISKMLVEKFGADGKEKSYSEGHFMQDWITFWDLKTWKTKDVIVQIGNSDMRLFGAAPPKNIKWNLVYSDFIIKNRIIKNYKRNNRM